jgi:hypothetical protein
MLSHWHDRLCEDGWHPATERFWEAVPCFYDLGTVKTVILFILKHNAGVWEYAEVYYWKLGGHDSPEYLDQAEVEIRHYKLHHSMNDLLWHDHGERPLWPE